MKITPRIAISCVIILLFLTSIKGQDDSLSVLQSDSLLTAYKNGTLYRLFQMDKEETYMFKIAGEAATYMNNSSGGIITQALIGFEKKIAPSLSIDNSLFLPAILPVQFFGLTTSVNYYYNLKKQIFEGLSANNFSADYFKFGIQQCIVECDIFDGYVSISEWSYQPSLILGYGIQRRVSSLGFFDISFYSRFNIATSNFEWAAVSLKYGFGLPKTKRYGK